MSKNRTVEKNHPHDIASILDGANVDVRARHHCSQPLLAHLGVLVTTGPAFPSTMILADLFFRMIKGEVTGDAKKE